ncbi:MAG: hypothetical protein HY867_10395 [Chloroflexi bacterium]|nr:hypothetical protein [Chloroflexota bacterium]
MKIQKSILLVLMTLALVSCSSTQPTTIIVTSTPRWFEIISSTPVPLPPYLNPPPNPTPISFPDFFEILKNTTKQTTDGELILFVKENDPKCHEFKRYSTWNTDVDFVFLNTTTKPLEIPTRFEVTISGTIQSDINPLWYEQDGSHIRASIFYWDDIPTEPYNSSVKIAGGEYYETTINIPFPDHISGTYIVKFVFYSYLSEYSAARFPNLWKGMITSNPIEICLIH